MLAVINLLNMFFCCRHFLKTLPMFWKNFLSPFFLSTQKQLHVRCPKIFGKLQRKKLRNPFFPKITDKKQFCQNRAPSWIFSLIFSAIFKKLYYSKTEEELIFNIPSDIHFSLIKLSVESLYSVVVLNQVVYQKNGSS